MKNESIEAATVSSFPKRASVPLNQAPVEVIDGIPVYSRRTRYVEVYEQIARDHLASMRPGASNPFIPDDLWDELQESTQVLVQRYAHDGDRVLDVGVGLGLTLKQFSDLERHGLDISIDYLKIAREAGIDVIFSRIEDMPYVDDSFDVVLSCDVLEHVFDLHECCRQMLRVLRPGGTLIVRVPYAENLAQYLDPDVPYEHVHVRSFDLAGLRSLFSRIYGYEFIEAQFAGYYIHPGRLSWRPLGREHPLFQILQSEQMQKHKNLHLLRKALAVDEQEMLSWIRELKREAPSTYAILKPHLISAIDINVVFRKPEHLSQIPRREPDRTGHGQTETLDLIADVARLSTLLQETRAQKLSNLDSYQKDRSALIAEIQKLNSVYESDRKVLVAEIERLNRGKENLTLIERLKKRLRRRTG